MAQGLLESSPVFAQRLNECAMALDPYVDFSVLDALRDGTALERVDVVQPVLFAVMVSLAALWRAAGGGAAARGGPFPGGEAAGRRGAGLFPGGHAPGVAGRRWARSAAVARWRGGG